MESQNNLKRIAISLLVFVAALVVTYGIGHYLETKTTRQINIQPGSSAQGALVYYKTVGQSDNAADVKNTLSMKYTVEILATQSRPEAEKIVAKLKKVGVDAFYTPLQNNNHVIYRVRQGIFDEQGQAKLAVKKLHTSGFSGKVIQLD